MTRFHGQADPPEVVIECLMKPAEVAVEVKSRNSLYEPAFDFIGYDVHRVSMAVATKTSAPIATASNRLSQRQ